VRRFVLVVFRHRNYPRRQNSYSFVAWSVAHRYQWEQIFSVSTELKNKRSIIARAWSFEDKFSDSYLLHGAGGQILMKLDFSGTPEEKQQLLLAFIQQQIQSQA
jgi:hypothetical protein